MFFCHSKFLQSRPECTYSLSSVDFKVWKELHRDRPLESSAENTSCDCSSVSRPADSSVSSVVRVEWARPATDTVSNRPPVGSLIPPWTQLSWPLHRKNRTENLQLRETSHNFRQCPASGSPHANIAIRPVRTRWESINPEGQAAASRFGSGAAPLLRAKWIWW